MDVRLAHTQTPLFTFAPVVDFEDVCREQTLRIGAGELLRDGRFIDGGGRWLQMFFGLDQYSIFAT